MRSQRDPTASGPGDAPATDPPKGKGPTARALALGLLVLPVQLGLVLLWGASTDLTLVEALARLLGMTTSGLPGYFLLLGVAAVLFLLVSLGSTWALAVAVLRDRRRALLTLGSSLAIVLVTGWVVGGYRSAMTESLVGRTEELGQRAEGRIDSLAARSRLADLRVEPGPTYASMGATADNPHPEWGALRWSVRIAADLQVPSSGPYGLTVEFRLPGESAGNDAPAHARREVELDLDEGRNRLDVTLDANHSRGYQGFWNPARSGGTLTVVLRRKVAPDELYGDGLGSLMRRARQLFGAAARDLQPTARTVELLRESYELGS